VLLYERESNRKAMLSGEYVESVVHPQHAWKRCNLDGRVEGARIGLEVKVVGIGMAADWDLLADDGIPHYVRVQVAWQMHVADLDEVHVISLVGGASGFRVFYIRRDLRLEAVLVGAAEAFWRRCAQKDCPPLDASDASRALVEALYPPPEKLIEAQAEGELADLIEARVHAAQRESSWKDQKEILSAQIREAMGKAGIGVAWSRVARATYSKDRNGKPYLRVNATKEAKAPRVVKRNAASAALIDDGEAF
jgi:predicted phage-related endonuclease